MERAWRGRHLQQMHRAGREHDLPAGEAMNIYASQSFIERLGCSVSWPDQKPVQGQTMDGWSGDLLEVSRIGEVAVMMHDASLPPSSFR